MSRSPGSTLFAYPFRPFFLLVGAYGGLIILAWVAFFLGWLTFPAHVVPVYWHAHEMLFGLVPAAIAGFLLTAISNWTGAPPLRSRGLVALVSLWIAGRLGMWLAGILPMTLVSAVDLAFLPALGAYAFVVLKRAGNRRNYFLVAIIGLLALANLGMHLGFLGMAPLLPRLAEIMALDLIALVMIAIAGRIVPAFTANWLRGHGSDPAVVRRNARLDAVALITTAAMIPADIVPAPPWVAAAVALFAAVANGLRLGGWAGWRTAREPLLWVLHLGYAWIVVALLLKAFAPVAGLPPSAWFHAMGTGAVGTLILGVMTRVALGHTGRPLALPRGAVSVYAAIIAAGIFRVIAALPVISHYTILVVGAALCWSAAYILFTTMYWPILSRPRVDGRPG
ncbi:MAG: NnrS family protein [Ectothiorhodospiraceae bacterium]|jgi:uncharacterized protein involved in response to NO